jgi:hypothetical protein
MSPSLRDPDPVHPFLGSNTGAVFTLFLRSIQGKEPERIEKDSVYMGRIL